MKTLLLSPHLDDAVLSAGQFLANQPGCSVVTVFAGIPADGLQTSYDRKCGFKSSRKAMQSRRLEDRDSLARLKCDPIYWDYLDSQYGESYEMDSIVADIIDLAQGYDLVLGPLGLVHHDHKMVLDSLLLAAKDIKAAIYLWEDLPNRVLYPEEVNARLYEIQPEKLAVPGGAGPMADKIRALLCYRSQLGTGDLNFDLLCVPERFWLIKERAGDE